MISRKIRLPDKIVLSEGAYQIEEEEENKKEPWIANPESFERRLKHGQTFIYIHCWIKMELYHRNKVA